MDDSQPLVFGRYVIEPGRPRAYTRPRDLTPAMRRYMTERGWIDRRTVTRIERPDPAHVARLYRIAGMEQAGPAVDVTA